MTLKGDAKLKRKLTLRTFVNLHARSRKPENLHSKVSDEKVQKSYLSWHWKVIQSLKKNLTFCLKNEIRNFVNFNSSSGETENLHFDRLLLPKECNVDLKQYIRVVSWKIIYGFKNDIRNLVNFHTSGWK